MRKFTFPKEERLNKEIWIKELFDKGSSFHLYPFRVRYLPHPVADASAHQILITVSTRSFKKAVDRNTIKRRIREAYRLNKHQIEVPSKLLIAYIYTAKEILPSSIIHSKLPQTFDRLKQSVTPGKNV